MSSKLTPLSPPFPPQVDRALANYPKQDGYILALFRVFANSVRFLTKCVPNLLDSESPLSIRERELVILRVTANNRCEYEWGVHVSVFAKQARLTLTEVKAITSSNADAPCWNTKEKTLLEVVDQLMARGSLDRSSLVELRKYWSKEQQLEICTLCGTYQTISYVANIAELENETFAASFPED